MSCSERNGVQIQNTASRFSFLLFTKILFQGALSTNQILGILLVSVADTPQGQSRYLYNQIPKDDLEDGGRGCVCVFVGFSFVCLLASLVLGLVFGFGVGFFVAVGFLIAKPFIIYKLKEMLLSDRLRELLGKGKQ